MSWKKIEAYGVPVSAGDDHPVVNVNWEDSVAFCDWLSKKEGKVYRLPTDREWSYAVGIGTKEEKRLTPEKLDAKLKEMYPWGKTWPPPLCGGFWVALNPLPEGRVMATWNSCANGVILCGNEYVAIQCSTNGGPPVELGRSNKIPFIDTRPLAVPGQAEIPASRAPGSLMTTCQTAAGVDRRK